VHCIGRLFVFAYGSRNSRILIEILRVRNPPASVDPAGNLLVFVVMNEPGKALHVERAF
jgi:hypothetical protein